MPSWAQLGGSCALLGSNLESLGCLLDVPGPNLELLDASWGQLRCSCALLGPNLESLGCLLGSTWSLLGTSWTSFGLNLEPLRASWAQLGASWTPLRHVQSVLAALSDPIWTPRWPSELQVRVCRANMSSNLPSSCRSRAFLTCKIINFP